mgnify:CR=1 FL=1
MTIGLPTKMMRKYRCLTGLKPEIIENADTQLWDIKQWKNLN